MFRNLFTSRRSLTIALAASFFVGVGLSVAWAKEKYGRIHDQMEKVHEGRKSPMGQTESELAKDAPAWEVVDKQLPAFKSMSEALSKSSHEDVKDSADGYVDAVTALAAAAQKRDLTASRAALKQLTSSCADCHFKDGPGGELKKEHEHKHKKEYKDKHKDGKVD